MIQWAGWIIPLILPRLVQVAAFSWWVTWGLGSAGAAGMSRTLSSHGLSSPRALAQGEAASQGGAAC